MNHAVELCPVIGRRLRLGVAVVCCFSFSGCIGATPLPKRTVTPSGTKMKSVDLTFIHPGQTTRGEVQEKLKAIDTGYQGDHFFLGRWSSSTWGGWIILAGMCCEAVGGAGRVWKSGNLLVEFDDAGVVKRFEPFDDAKALQDLGPVAADTHLQLEPPLELTVRYSRPGTALVADAKILLSADTFDFEELGRKKKRQKFTVPAQEFAKVDAVARSSDATYISERLHFIHDLRQAGGPRGNKLNLIVTMPQLVTLMSYSLQSQRVPTSNASSTHN